MDYMYTTSLKSKNFYSNVTLSKKTIVFLVALSITFLDGYIAAYIPVPQSLRNLVCEIFYLLIFLLTFTQERNLKIRCPGVIYLIGYVFWTILSGYFNNTSFYVTYLHSRYCIDLIIVIYFIENSYLSKYELKFIMMYIVILCIIQIPASFLNVLLYGVQEKRVGTLTCSGGGLGTAFPIIPLVFTLSYYFYINKRFYVLFFSLLFIYIGLSNGKRAICFMYPIFIILGYLLDSFLSRSLEKIVKNILVLVITIPIMFVISVYFLGNMANFEEIKYEENYRDKIIYINDEMERYSFSDKTMNDGLTDTRGSCLTLMSHYFINGYADFWWGVGPMSTTPMLEHYGYEKYGFGYGMGGWIYDSISVGIPGMIFIFVFYLRILLYLLRGNYFQSLNQVGKFICFGSILGIINFLFNYFFYHDVICWNIVTQVIPIIAYVVLTTPAYQCYFRNEGI